jgi:hypothetical protein
MPISSERLHEIHNFDNLLSFCSEELDWPLPEGSTLDDFSFEWDAGDLRLSENEARRLQGGLVRQLRPIRQNQPWGVFFVEFAEPRIYHTALRQILRNLVPNRRRDATLRSWQHTNLLFICSTRDYQQITFAHFRGDLAASAKLSTFGWTVGSAYLRTLLEFNLPKLGWPKDNGADESGWISQWTKAFDKEPLTKEFFKRFDDVIDAAKGDLQKHQKLPAAQAYSRAQLLIERLLFLYFLQNRGWLDQTKNYLLTHFEKYRGDKQSFTYYEDFLEKLFFTLATPFDYKGPGSGARLEGIPFLNGGLFDDDEFAQTNVRKKDNPPLRIRNQTFAFIFDHLLEAFNFTVREDTPLNQDVAVDPEMLGKVFESIILHAEAADPDANAPDKRKATGSYYTPRIVVHFICREALRLLLLNHVPSGSDWGKRLRTLMDIDASDGLDVDELATLKALLAPKEAASVLAVVETLRCLDPAVGSGAFPVGLLQELVNLRRVLRTVADGYVDPIRKGGQQWIHETKARIVENCLYGVDIQQQAIEICRLRLWLSLIVDYDLGVDPLQADRAQFVAAIKSISQLPNLEMNFRRGDSLLDTISGIPVRVEGGVVTRYRDQVEAIQKRGHKLHNERKAEKKKELRLEILQQRLSLAERVLLDQIRNIDKQEAATANWFGETKSESEKRRQLADARENLNQALAKIEADRRERETLAKSPLAADFYPRLRKLEGADFDSPFNFVWNIDYAEIFTPKPKATLGGDMAFVNETQNQGELLVSGKPEVRTPQLKGGFDLILGNPPFVTARNPAKRELYRERWAGVCHKKYLLVAPFFAASFGLLRPKGELGFIVSNAFAKREFGRPLIEKFFPAITLQKIIDCSGLMFPGHGTPTFIVFGAPDKADDKSRILVAASLPGGGDLRTPPEESPLWHTLAREHENPGYSDSRVAISSRDRGEFARWPWNLDAGPEPTKRAIEVSANGKLRDFLGADIGFMFVLGRNDIFIVPSDLLRRFQIGAKSVRRIHPGEEIRDYHLRGTEYVIFPYDPATLRLTEFAPKSAERRYFRMFEETLSDRPTFSGTFADAGRIPYQFHQLPIERAKNPKSIAFPEIATHAHFVFDPDGCAFNQKGPLIKLPSSASSQEHYLLGSVLNSSAALFWLKQICFSKRESEEGARDTYFEFAGGKVEQLPVPLPVASALRGKSNPVSENLGKLAARCTERGRQLPAFALRKLFEKASDAYHTWNATLPGYIAPGSECLPAFASSEALREKLKAVIVARETRRGEMIDLQEEMDWFCYEAYGLISRNVVS